MKQHLKIEHTFEVYTSPKKLSASDTILYNKAKNIAEKAYAPYSKFLVGCALQLDNGEVITANNQENMAYPSGLCAERIALFCAGANFPDAAIQTVFIYSKGDFLEKDKFLSPCGACRQVMVESQMRQKFAFRILLCGNDKKVLEVKEIEDIMPFAFGKLS
jgi:cytidine deaminase